jgi:hypothetical protein
MPQAKPHITPTARERLENMIERLIARLDTADAAVDTVDDRHHARAFWQVHRLCHGHLPSGN